jgi:hypothetical protein
MVWSRSQVLSLARLVNPKAGAARQKPDRAIADLCRRTMALQAGGLPATTSTLRLLDLTCIMNAFSS